LPVYFNKNAIDGGAKAQHKGRAMVNIKKSSLE